MLTLFIAQDDRIVKLGESLYSEKQGQLHRYILNVIEKSLIERILQRTGGNQLKAARILGINRNTLRTKIKKLEIDANRWKD